VEGSWHDVKRAKLDVTKPTNPTNPTQPNQPTLLFLQSHP